MDLIKELKSLVSVVELKDIVNTENLNADKIKENVKKKFENTKEGLENLKLDNVKTWITYGDTEVGKLYNGKMTNRRREWRGVKSTLIDFKGWCGIWKDMLAFSAGSPRIPLGFLEYRWMASYLTVPSFVDRNTIGLRGPQLEIAHLHFRKVLKAGEDNITTLIKNDQKLGASVEASKKIVLFDEMMMIQIMCGFPNLIGLPYQLMPVFLLSEIDQLSCTYYIDAIESFGLPSETCPVPTSEAGAAVVDAYPKVGCCFISSSMPCDGSIMASSYQSRRFKVPTFHLTLPVRFKDGDTDKVAAQEIKNCIKFIEEQTGEKFDWDAYFTCMKRWNKETAMELEKWDINKTDYPQITGPSYELFRKYSYQMEGARDPEWYDLYCKVNKIMHEAYEKKTMCSRGMNYRAITWSCPAHYYANFSVWAEACWGINVVIDMENMNYTEFMSEDDPEQAYLDLAKLYERMTMRKHTNGGYANTLDELWRVVEEFNIDLVFMYQHVACKTMAGLQGLFDEQARERGVKLIWIEHDLMDPRTVSRRSMRDKVNSYMINVMRAEPVDASLMDYDDADTW